VEDVNRQIGLASTCRGAGLGLEVLQSITIPAAAINNRLALLLTYLTIIGTAVLIPNHRHMLGDPVFDIGRRTVWYWIRGRATRGYFLTTGGSEERWIPRNRLGW